MSHSKKKHHRTRGSALMLAIGLLVIFSALGTAYLTRMVTENEANAVEIRQARARALAAAGIQVGIGALQQAREQDQNNLDGVLGETTHSFPTYEGVRDNEGLQLEVFSGRRAETRVTISDESGKVNLNHAPASVLQLVLGVDGETARGITGSLPRPDESPEQAAENGRRWLLGVEDLLDRGLVTEEQYAAIDRDLVTVYTVADHGNPVHFLNVNAAPVPVLAALFDLSLEATEEAVEKRPYKSLKEMADASGKPAFTFNVKPDFTQPAKLPGPLSFSSNCFRIRSESVYETGGRSAPGARGYVEAVVVFNADGGLSVVYWNSQAPVAVATLTTAGDKDGAAAVAAEA